MPRAVDNPRQRFRAAHLELEIPPPPADMEVYEETARSALSTNDSPDIGFSYSLNPYRGCFHACAYCYARPTHTYLDYGAGTDFDRKLVAKVNIASLLRRELSKPSWKGELVVLSGVTDCYQPIEATYRLTRSCLEVLRDHYTPVGIITKGVLVRRDVDVLAQIAERASASVGVSIGFARDEDARLVEPFASPPSKRFETLRILHEAGIRTTVGVAPVIPGLNDAQIPEVLERAKAAGATQAFMTILRLPLEVRAVFEARIEEAYPLRAKKILNATRELRGGAMNDARFGHRMRGEGARYAAIETIFEKTAARLGLNVRETNDPPHPEAPRKKRQLELF